MYRFAASHDACRLACSICTFVVLVCLLTTSVGAVPVLSGAPGNESSPEEFEAHSEVRVDGTRHVRLRSFPDSTVAPIPELSALEAFHRCGQSLQPLVLPCFVGSGIRLRC